MANPRVVPLAWMRAAWEEERKVLGPDPWAYGLGESNRKNLQTIIRHCYEQGLIGRKMTIEGLFVYPPRILCLFFDFQVEPASKQALIQETRPD